MLACPADSDDAIEAQHLVLEVGVVGDCHKLGLAWPSQDRVVGPLELDHVKGESLPPDVLGSPKADG